MQEGQRQVICPLTDIPNPGALGFSPPGARFPDEWFLVRYGDSVYAYHNVCPHAGNFLNWKADAFLTRDKSLIMCSAHGALFDPVSGSCVAGPCPGRALKRLPIAVEEGMVVVYFDCEG
jgi:nitrite reductase/ring-hydroxylating ferredoxin subunit